MSTRTAAQNKILGWYYFIVAFVTLIIALLQQSIGEWGLWGVFMGVAVAFLVLGDAGSWTVVDTLSIGIWIAMGGLFVSQIRTLDANA